MVDVGSIFVFVARGNMQQRHWLQNHKAAFPSLALLPLHSYRRCFALALTTWCCRSCCWTRETPQSFWLLRSTLPPHSRCRTPSSTCASYRFGSCRPFRIVLVGTPEESSRFRFCHFYLCLSRDPFLPLFVASLSAVFFSSLLHRSTNIGFPLCAFIYHNPFPRSCLK